MDIQFNDVQLQYRSLRGDLDGAIERVLADGTYVLGPEVDAFEKDFAAYIGARDAIGVGSGTSALELILDALGVGPGDEVIVPAVSAAATAMSVMTIGARPVFADISTRTWTLDPDSVTQRRSPRTKAIIAVHLYGMPANLEALSALDLPLVEDAAQAHGSVSRDRPCGSIGIAAAFSFYPTKNLGGYGDGGMVTTSDPTIGRRIRQTRNYGQTRNYVSDLRGWNSRLDELQAAILRVKLKKLDEWNTRRRAIAEMYWDGLTGLPLRLQEAADQSNYHLFVIRHQRRDALRDFLASHGIPTLIHYPTPLPRHPAFAATKPHECPVADRLSGEVCSLPIHGHMTDEQAAFVVDKVQSFLKN